MAGKRKKGNTDEQTNLKLNLHSTGDFWIDNGIVSLWRELRKTENKNVIIEPKEMKPDCTSISLSGDLKDIEKMLYDTKEELLRIGGDYVYETGNPGWYYDDIKKEPVMYSKRDFYYYLKPFYDQLSSQPESDGKKSEISKLPKVEQDKIQDFLKTYELKGYGNNKNCYYTAKLVPTINWEAKLLPGNKKCSFSDDGFEAVCDVKGYYYPLLVKKSKMETFYSAHKGGLKIGSPYALASIFTPKLSYYSKLKEKEWVYLFPSSPTLGLIDEAHTIFAECRDIRNSKYSNFRPTKPPLITHYPNETVLSFLLSVFYHTRDDLDELGRFPEEVKTGKKLQDEESEDEEEDTESSFEEEPESVREARTSIITKEELIKKIKETSGGLSLVMLCIGGATTEVIRYSLIADVFDLMYNISKEGGKVVNFLSSFEREELGKKPQRSLPREFISRRILNLEPITDIIEEFIFERAANKKARGPIPSCKEVIKVYVKEVEKVDEKMLNECEQQGKIIGAKAFDEKSMGTLYDLRNAKTMDQFIKSLEHVPFDLGVQVREELLKLIEKENWERIKSLVVIYAMNTYLSAQYKTKKENEEIKTKEA